MASRMPSHWTASQGVRPHDEVTPAGTGLGADHLPVFLASFRRRIVVVERSTR